MIRIVLGAIALLGVSVAPVKAAVDIQEVTSPGGITAWLVEEPSIPFVALEIRFRGGTSLDAPGKRGAMNLMTGLLEEGAGDLTSRDFATRAEDLSARFSYDVGDDSTSISAEFLNEYRQESLELLRLSIIEPTFPEDAVERVRAQVLSGLESDLKDPNKIAALRFDELAFGAHPYGSAGEGTTDSVKALSRDDLVAAHRGAFSRDKLYVAAVGDITAEDLGEMLDFLFADLPETGADLPERVAFGMEGGVSVVPFDTPQSVVVFGHDGIKRNDPDFFAGYLLLQVLGGGGFNSRLYEEVREKRGLTYGIGAYLAPKDLSEQVRGGVSTDNARVAQTIEVVRGEWQRLAQDGLTEDELSRVKTYLTGAYPLRFDGNRRIANILVGMQMDALGLDYVNTRNDRINAVTMDDIRRVTERIIDPEGLHFVVVGQPQGVVEQTSN